MLNIIASKFIQSAVKKTDYPTSGYTEVAFVGKSNVGKSSLINTLLNRKQLAKTSSTPGKTRLINFFQIEFYRSFKEENSDREKGVLSFVDLPGYGYAKVSFKERDKWKAMVSEYFNFRAELKLVILLMDLRHKVDTKDLMLLEMILLKDMHIIIAGTKSDKIPKNKINTHLKSLKEGIHNFLSEKDLIEKKKLILDLIPFSALQKSGVRELLNSLEKNIFC